jgi:hypothetical protein
VPDSRDTGEKPWPSVTIARAPSEPSPDERVNSGELRLRATPDQWERWETETYLPLQVIRERLQSQEATIAFLRAVGAVRPEKNIRALEYQQGLEAALDAAFSKEEGSDG